MVLQILPSDVFPTPSVAVVVALSLTATVLSGLIAYQAFRGYRRNDSKPMLYLAIGFVFITTIPFFVDLVFYPVFGRMYGARTASVVLPTAKYSIQVVGLTFVLYSLYSRQSDTRSE